MPSKGETIWLASPSFAFTILWLRERDLDDELLPKSRLEMCFMLFFTLSRNDPELVTAAATSSLDTVTNAPSAGLVLASQAALSFKPRKTKG